MAAFDFAKVKDPTFFKENVLNAHASFRTYASREEYLAGESSLALKLDGIWKFAYAKNYTSAIPGFEKTDYDCSGWDDIHVLNVMSYTLATISRALVAVAGYMGSGNVTLMLLFTAIAALGQGPWQGDMNAVIAACSE